MAFVDVVDFHRARVGKVDHIVMQAVASVDAPRMCHHVQTHPEGVYVTQNKTSASVPKTLKNVVEMNTAPSSRA